MEGDRCFGCRSCDHQGNCIWFNRLQIILGSFELYIARRLFKSIRRADGKRNAFLSSSYLYLHFGRNQLEQAGSLAAHLHRTEPRADLLASQDDLPGNLPRRASHILFGGQSDHWNNKFLGGHTSVKIGFRAARHFETGEVPGYGDFQGTVETKVGNAGAQIGSIGGSAIAYPHTAVEIFGIASRRIDLHSIVQLVSKQVAVISSKNDCL